MDEQALSLEAVVTDCWQHVVTDDATLVVETDATVRADRQRLRQLFENLFRNAVEHGGSDVTVTVGDLPDGFYVADDGPGMPAESLEGSRPDSVAAENAGFGLSIVERVAESHGWEMAVADPGPGTGARFEFTGTTTDGP
jgi:signal transduction histidine kinase